MLESKTGLDIFIHGPVEYPQLIVDIKNDPTKVCPMINSLKQVYDKKIERSFKQFNKLKIKI